MAHRKEFFQAKVLQKLYPAASKPKEEPKPPHNVQIPAKNTCVKRKASQVDSANGKTQSTSTPDRRRLYTVLPPPADYKPDPEKSITFPLLDNIKSAKDPAEDSSNSSSEDPDHEEKEGEQRRKRRRRKRKPALHQDSGRNEAAPVSESSIGQSQTPVDEGEEHISRNKKRKLKKKRHKEKLRSMGLMPRAAALEFTYQKDCEEEQQDVERRAAEVAEFLRTTTEFYLSDSSSHVDKLPLSWTVDDLLGSIACSDEPASILKQLYNLKVLVHQRETDKLEEALMEFQNTSCLAESKRNIYMTY
ncbi:glutamate-rich protein 1 isoform X1 [Xyrichtys novacula]|uniref:Glutamate-rich protein 1 isoform X1 n=1 Tax=Xyrichtys novacula TaxID=13765 RepID=A0AAV1GL08_XYRNO|nr:glutamate-rich protein 1 isoform X1 [Xyrichtys novacula]